MTNHFNELSKIMDSLGRRFDLSRVFNDLLTMSICSFHQVNIQSQLQKQDAENERLYNQTIKPYKPAQLNEFARAFGILQASVWDNPYTDILGEYFTINITKGQNGQYFTPEPICDFIAQIQCSNHEQIGQRVLDPACGSGRMLLGAAKRDYRNYFYGADSSNICTKMAALNLFLNGMTGEVAWLNSLSMEWFGGWKINQNGLGILPIEKEQSQIWTEAPKLSNKQSEQLTLF